MLAKNEHTERHVLSVLVDNEPGVLGRVVGLFSGRGYNIESLTVSETEHNKHVSRITIVTSGTPSIIDQIEAQLGRLVPIHKVVDLSHSGPMVERELALVKVAGKGDARAKALQISKDWTARVADETSESYVFELTGESSKIDQFIVLMLPLGLVEVSRTGIAAISRGAQGM
jgi:acetolactate synthase I/III small subunit